MLVLSQHGCNLRWNTHDTAKQLGDDVCMAPIAQECVPIDLINERNTQIFSLELVRSNEPLLRISVIHMYIQACVTIVTYIPEMTHIRWPVPLREWASTVFT